MKKNNKAKMITLLVGAGLLFGACGTTQATTIDKASTSAAASSAVSSSEAAVVQRRCFKYPGELPNLYPR